MTFAEEASIWNLDFRVRVSLFILGGAQHSRGEGSLCWLWGGLQQDSPLSGPLPHQLDSELGVSWLLGSHPTSSDSVPFAAVTYEVVLSFVKVTNLLLMAIYSLMGGPLATSPWGHAE